MTDPQKDPKIILADFLTVPCPLCGAKAGELCHALKPNGALYDDLGCLWEDIYDTFGIRTTLHTARVDTKHRNN
jgi:hypothetical protein